MLICLNLITATYGGWLEIRDDVSRTKYTHTGMSLKQGGLYSIRVGAVNKAGFVAAFDTSGIVIDNEPPIVSIWFFLNWTCLPIELI